MNILFSKSTNNHCNDAVASRLGRWQAAIFSALSLCVQDDDDDDDVAKIHTQKIVRGARVSFEGWWREVLTQQMCDKWLEKGSRRDLKLNFHEFFDL